MATLQLLSATVASGGVESNVLYAYPLLPVFLASLVQVRVTLIVSGALMLGVFGIFLVDPHYPGLRELNYGVWIDYLTIVWSFCSVLAVAVYTRFQSDELVDRVQQELREREAAQAELEAVSLAKDRFLAYLSHEIRNPLTTIVGASELLGLQEEDSRRDRYLLAIKSSADSMQALVDSVLDYSQAESGGIPMKLESLAIQPLLSELSAQFVGSAESKGVSLYVEVSASAPTEVIGDLQLLRQVLANLLGNAIKFTPSGGEVHVSVDRVRSRWEGAMLSVRDNGIGIPLAAQERIFEPYQRHVGEVPDQKGTGLGLAISHAILANMGTKLKLESEVGRGSRFFFELASSRAPMESFELPSSPLSGQNILIAVGEASVAVMVAGMVTSLGAGLSLARNGREAQTTFEQEIPDGVIIDLSVSRLGGVEAARSMREMLIADGAQHASCRLVGLTEEGQRLSDEEAALFDEIMSSPVSPEQLLEAFRLPDF